MTTTAVSLQKVVLTDERVIIVGYDEWGGRVTLDLDRDDAMTLADELTRKAERIPCPA